MKQALLFSLTAKLAAVFLMIAMTAASLSAQDTSLFRSWNPTMDVSVNMNQTSYSDNWAGTESGSMVWTLNMNASAQKQISGYVHNKNTIRLAFGQTSNQDNADRNWSVPLKSTDLIDFESYFRMTYWKVIDPYTTLRIESQFVDGSEPDYKRNFNPTRFTESVGLSRALIDREKQDWNIRLGAALRQTFDRDKLDLADSTRYTKISRDGGIEFVSDFVSPVAKDRILFTSKLNVFKALINSEKDALHGTPQADYWMETDINWENIFTASITKYLMVNLYTQLLYDKEIDLAGRFKQTLSLGVTYKFM